MLCPCVQIARPCLSKFKMTIIRNQSFVSVIKRTPWSFVLQVSHQCLFKRREFSASHARLYIKRSSSLTDGPLFLSSRTSRSLSPFVRPRFVLFCISLCRIVLHCAAALVLYPEPRVPLGNEVRELLNATCFFLREVLKIGSQGSTCLSDLSKSVLAPAHCPVPVGAKKRTWTNVNST